MIRAGHIDIPWEELAELCRKYHVRELSLFGSVLRDDFHADSDIDILVVPGAPIGLIEYIGLQEELAEVLSRKVDLVEKRGLKRLIRDEVINASRVVYAA